MIPLAPVAEKDERVMSQKIFSDEASALSGFGEPLPRVGEAEAGGAERPCPYVIQSEGGTAHCSLAEADAKVLVAAEARGAERERGAAETKAAFKLADTVWTLIMSGYDGPCMGEEFADVMDAVVAYDLARADSSAPRRSGRMNDD